MSTDFSKLKRPIQPMPDFVKKALEERGLMSAFRDFGEERNAADEQAGFDADGRVLRSRLGVLRRGSRVPHRSGRRVARVYCIDLSKKLTEKLLQNGLAVRE